MPKTEIFWRDMYLKQNHKVYLYNFICLKQRDKMITSIRIQNFKSIRDSGTIHIRPLTILVGPNNSGKSSILQTLMLLKQSIESVGADPIVLHGKYINFGSFEDVIFGQNTEDELLGITIEMDRYPSPFFSFYTKTTLRRMYPYTGRGITVNFSVGFNEKNNLIYLEKSEIFIPKGKGTIKYTIKKIGDNEYELYARSLRNREKASFRKKVIPIKFYNARFVRYGYMDDIKIELYNTLMSISPGIEKSFQSVYYIGPLREYPQRIYQQSEERPTDVGLRGEKTADVLWDSHTRKKQLHVLDEVNEWFKRMGINVKINLRVMGKGGYFVLEGVNTETNLSVNLSDVGFGISQILPVLVSALYSPSRSMILIEQPEIHLHPKVQSSLGDFLSTVCVDGKKIVVETHSEHLINRVLRNIAEEKIDRDDVAIYYCDLKEGVTHIQELKVNEYGQIENWPPGFFEEKFTETIEHIRAIAKRKGSK